MVSGVTDWGPVLFATLVPVIVLVLGGLIHVVWRMGRSEQRMATIEREVCRIGEEVSWLVRRGQRRDADGER